VVISDWLLAENIIQAANDCPYPPLTARLQQDRWLSATALNTLLAQPLMTLFCPLHHLRRTVIILSTEGTALYSTSV